MAGGGGSQWTVSVDGVAVAGCRVPSEVAPPHTLLGFGSAYHTEAGAGGEEVEAEARAGVAADPWRGLCSPLQLAIADVRLFERGLVPSEAELLAAQVVPTGGRGPRLSAQRLAVAETKARLALCVRVLHERGRGCSEDESGVWIGAAEPEAAREPDCSGPDEQRRAQVAESLKAVLGDLRSLLEASDDATSAAFGDGDAGSDEASSSAAVVGAQSAQSSPWLREVAVTLQRCQEHVVLLELHRLQRLCHAAASSARLLQVSVCCEDAALGFSWMVAVEAALREDKQCTELMLYSGRAAGLVSIEQRAVLDRWLGPSSAWAGSASSPAGGARLLVCAPSAVGGGETGNLGTARVIASLSVV